MSKKQTISKFVVKLPKTELILERDITTFKRIIKENNEGIEYIEDKEYIIIIVVSVKQIKMIPHSGIVKCVVIDNLGCKDFNKGDEIFSNWDDLFLELEFIQTIGVGGFIGKKFSIVKEWDLNIRNEQKAKDYHKKRLKRSMETRGPRFGIKRYWRVMETDIPELKELQYEISS